jgi:hypothetical protein
MAAAPHLWLVAGLPSHSRASIDPVELFQISSVSAMKKFDSE